MVLEVPKCVDGLLGEDRGIIHSPADPDPRAQRTLEFLTVFSISFISKEVRASRESAVLILFIHFSLIL